MNIVKLEHEEEMYVVWTDEEPIVMIGLIKRTGEAFRFLNCGGIDQRGLTCDDLNAIVAKIDSLNS